MQLYSLFGSLAGAQIAIFLLANIFIIYLLFAPTSNKEIPQSSKAAKIIVGIIIGVLLIGILAAVIMPKLMSSRVDDGKRKTVCLKMQDIKHRLDLFSLDNGTYPDTEEGLKALLENPNLKKYPNYRAKAYMKSLPNDPWGTPFIFINKGKDIDIISLGEDKEKETKYNISFSNCK
jgi:general secretion pathway protein G